jgi:hypothetical protein
MTWIHLYYRQTGDIIRLPGENLQVSIEPRVYTVDIEIPTYEVDLDDTPDR